MDREKKNGQNRQTSSANERKSGRFNRFSTRRKSQLASRREPHADERPLIFLLTQTGLGFLMPELEAESARQQTDIRFYTWSDATGPTSALDNLLTDLKGFSSRSIVIDETMRADHAALIQDKV